MSSAGALLSAGINAGDTGTDLSARIAIIVVGVIVLVAVALVLRLTRRRSVRRALSAGAGQESDADDVRVSETTGESAQTPL